jgi:hypothetical protein
LAALKKSTNKSINQRGLMKKEYPNGDARYGPTTYKLNNYKL